MWGRIDKKADDTVCGGGSIIRPMTQCVRGGGPIRRQGNTEVFFSGKYRVVGGS